MWWNIAGELASAIFSDSDYSGSDFTESTPGWVELGGVDEESVTIPDDQGIFVLTDLDGDGIIDHVTRHRFSGGFEVWSAQDWGLPQGSEVA